MSKNGTPTMPSSPFTRYRLTSSCPAFHSNDLSVSQVSGPHISALYVRAASLRSSVAPITHHFLRVDTVGYKLQPGGPGYELVHGAAGVPIYLRSLTPEGTLKAAFIASAAQESALCDRLLGFLRTYSPRVRIVGDAHNGNLRAPTISFVVQGIRSPDIVRACDETGTVRHYVFNATLLNILGGSMCGRSVYDTVTFTRTPSWMIWTQKLTSMTESYGCRWSITTR